MNNRSGTASREKILEAALTIFSEYGYRGAGIRMIAAAAKISVGGVYLYFKNKEELYFTLIQERFDDLFTKLKEITKDTGDPVEAITGIIMLHLEYSRSHRELILIQAKETGLAFGMDMKRVFFKKQRQVIGEIIERGVLSGVFTPCDPGEAAKVIISILRGFVFSMVVDPENLFSPQGCCDLILGGLFKRQGGETGDGAGKTVF